jgi:hypothetical protein
MTHWRPAQQGVVVEQALLTWHATPHTPAVQVPLQQSVPTAQVAPLAVQAVAAQMPFEQVPVQQLRMELHCIPLAEQAVAQRPFVHWRPQQSCGVVHVCPLPPQQICWPRRFPHAFEQQSEACVQDDAAAPHALHSPLAQLSEQHWPASVQVVSSAWQLPQTLL